ncbi:MAG: DUF4174 domain-containing protein [Pseudomonadota bacterium]
MLRVTARLFVALSLVLAVQMLSSPSNANMKRFAWQYRPLLVFAPALDDPKLARQHALLSGARGGLRERDMVLIVVAGESVRAAGGPAPRMSAAALRARYGVSPDRFEVLLIGKDTGVKRRSSTPLPFASLASQIDRMPMRRQEMRRQRATQ